MAVAGKRAGDAQPIGAGLLLIDPPLPSAPFLPGVEIPDELGPLDAALDRDHAALVVERQHTVQGARVDEHTVLAELLAAHCMPSSRDRDRPTGRFRLDDGALQFVQGVWFDD